MNSPTDRLTLLGLKIAARSVAIALTTCAGLQPGAGADATGARDSSTNIPVRGLHLSAPGKNDLPSVVEFIRTVLPKEGVNTLVLEFNYRFAFQSRPEFADPSALGKAEMQQIVKACRDGKTTGLGKWEASENGTQSAIDLVPKDLVICDWHYNKAPETPLLFAKKGFSVVVCPWRKPAVGLAQLEQIRGIRNGADSDVARRALGVMQTTWGGFTSFAAAYQARQSGQPVARNSASESADCFATLFQAARDKP